MSAFMRWGPLKRHWTIWKDAEEIEQRLSTFLRRPARDGDREAVTIAEWTPLVDISEDQREYLVKAELPEIKKEDVHLTVQDNVLCISGERKSTQEEGKTYHRVERAYGSFIRSFTLPDDTDATRVAAEYKDGILAIHVPKLEKVRPTSIDLKAA